MTSHNELQAEAGRFSKQLLARYGLPLLQSKYGSPDECAVTVTTGLTKNGTTAETFKSVREWLMKGLPQFLEFPPTLEALIQLSNLVNAYPITEYTVSMRDAWYRFNTECGQRYGKMWKGDGGFDLLTKERVWLSKCEESGVTPEEMLSALHRMINSTLFRIYPPSMEQFFSAVLAIRCAGAPLLEEAWIMAVSTHTGVGLHPLVRKAKGMIGALEINENMESAERKFKKIYQEFLSQGVIAEDRVDDSTPVVERTYLDKEAVLRIFAPKPAG
jgi:hypothetical protein